MSDCISRRAAITAIDNYGYDGEDFFGNRWIYKENAVEAIEMVEPLPPAEPKRIRGYWMPQDFNKRNGNISTCVYYFPKCSVCGHVGDERFAFCPNCGADMRGEQNE